MQTTKIVTIPKEEKQTRRKELRRVITGRSVTALLFLLLSVYVLIGALQDETLQKKAQYRGEFYDAEFKKRQDEFQMQFDADAEEYANDRVLEYTKNKLTANAAGITKQHENTSRGSGGSEGDDQIGGSYPTDTLAPKDLWYVFANTRRASGEVYYSGGFATADEAMQDHRYTEGRGGLLAVDIGTSGRSLYLRAPDLKGESVDWKVGANSMEREGVGNYITLTTESEGHLHTILIGHVAEWKIKDGDTVRTGQAIGKSGGCPGMENQGISTGCHVHLELYFDGSVVPYTGTGAQYRTKVQKVSSEKPELLKKPYNEAGLAALSKAMSQFENSTFKNNPGGMKEPYTFDCENYTVDGNRNMLFDSENDGWECLSRSLRRYRNKGIHLQDLIMAWTDTTQEREVAYTDFVAEKLGVSWDTPLSDIF